MYYLPKVLDPSQQTLRSVRSSLVLGEPSQICPRLVDSTELGSEYQEEDEIEGADQCDRNESAEEATQTAITLTLG
jgi:hypothetical protein